MTFVGRVQRDKGVFDLLDAFRTLRASTAHLGLIYVGNGKDIEQLEREARASEVSADILFMGRVDHRQLSTVVRHSSVVVTPTHPSFPEGFPKTVLESLAVGVPVVAPRTGPFPYAIDHDRNGLLFEPGNPEDLLKCLGRIVKDTETLERLRRGALDTSRQLLERCMGFGEAVEVAFSTTARP
jgi:glycosyltransferase involved in cell wall biosynthesis